MSNETSLKQRKSSHLRSHTLPVTALAHLDHNTILSGEGGLLCLRSTHNHDHASWRIFEDQAIHGIVVDTSSDRVLVYGGRQVQILSIAHLEGRTGLYRLIKDGPSVLAEDWILDACFENSKATLVTAHNALLTLEREQSSWQVNVLVLGSNTILYSAHIVQTSDQSWIVAAGTAFGDVILWSCTRPRANESTVSTHFSFSAHEGSTFGVRISPPLRPTLQGGESRILASCSDDRTIRVWDISDLSSAINANASFDRSTGFGADSSQHDEHSGRPRLLAKVMGHASRIWHVRFDVSHNEVAVKSFGEDATSITWSLLRHIDGASHPYELVRVNAVSGNTGKHIWSVATKDSGHVVVGGADGAIAGLPATTMPDTIELRTPVVEERLHTNRDILKAYQFLDDTMMLTVTQEGVAAVIDISTTQGSLHTFSLPDLANHSIVSAISGVAIIGGSGEQLYAYRKHATKLIPIPCQQGKIAYLATHTAQVSQKDNTERIAIVVTRINSDWASMMILDAGDQDVVVIQERHIQLPRESIVTSSAYLTLDKDRSFVTLGLRGGGILLWLLDLDSADEGRILSSVLNTHIEAVTAMRWLPRLDDLIHVDHILSTSRDGTYAIHRLIEEDGSLCLKLIHRLELSIGANVEGFLLTPQQELLVYGFKSKHFEIHSVTNHRLLYSIECGGAHRSWAVAWNQNKLHFTWTKASRTFLRKCHTTDFELIKKGGHGREIKSMALLPGSQSIVATGGQDTDIRLWQRLQTTSTELRCLHILRQHNTGPQHLQFSSDGQYLFSSGGFEEFFVWRLDYHCPIHGIGIVCESVHPRTGKSDLRITSFHASKVITDARKSIWQVAMTYSDSRIGLWHYSGQTWQQVVEADYLTSCPTSITPLSSDMFATLATDGCVAIWHYDVRAATPTLQWSARQQLHQNAILSSCPVRLADDTMLLITGGDDNAITFTMLKRNQRSWQVHNSSTISKAHAAAVTALSLHRDSRTRKLYLVSAGLDQQFVLWEIHLHDDTPPWITSRKLQSTPSAVADISSSGLIHDTASPAINLLLCGVGTEIWSVDIPDEAIIQ